MTETPTTGERSTLGARLRERVGSISPFSLVMLGFVGFLGNAFEQLAVLQLFHLFWLFAFWPLVVTLIGGVRRSLGRGEESAAPGDWVEMDVPWWGYLAFVAGIPLSALNPLVFRQDAMQLLGSVVALVRHRGSLPSPETHTQSVDYRLPVDGTWTVVNGSPVKEHSHSWFPATQRYAYDFVVTDEAGRTRPAGADTSIENYYCYDRPVLAPASGTVVDVGDGDPELGRAGGLSHPFKRRITGNYVTIRHADAEYSCLVHLVPGSIDVDPGDRVERAEQVGRCGHSGNSSEPHLHVQVQDHPTFEMSAGLPVRFADVAVETPGTAVAEPTDWSGPDHAAAGRYVHVGQRVTHIPDADRRRPAARRKVPEPASTPDLTGVTTLGAVGKGLSTGGLATVLAGFVVSSLTTVAVGLAVLAALAALTVVYRATRRRSTGDRSRRTSFATTAGVALAAVLVGVPVVWSGLPNTGPVAVGVGTFLAGFLLYGASWEYGRRYLLDDGGTAVTSTG